MVLSTENQTLSSETRHGTLFNLNLFVTSAVESICLKFDILFLWDFMLANNRKLILHRSFCSNLQIIRVISATKTAGLLLSWHPSWSNSLWQGWGCGLVHCPGGNATAPIWRVLAFSDGISSWTPLKPQHTNPKPNPNPLANQLWCIDSLTPPTPLIIPHRLPGFLESLMPPKNWCSIHARCSKSSVKDSIRVCSIFPSLKHNFIAYRSSKVSDWIFEIHQLWQSGFSMVYSNSCCSYSFEAEILKIGQSSHKMFSNNILNFQESITILNAHTKKVWKLIVCISYLRLVQLSVLFAEILKILYRTLHLTNRSFLSLRWSLFKRLRC